MKLSNKQINKIKLKYLNNDDSPIDSSLLKSNISLLLDHISALEKDNFELRNNLLVIFKLSQKTFEDLKTENFNNICKEYAECPKCHRETEVRINSKNGNKFIGCLNFPNCRWTKSLSSTSRYSNYIVDNQYFDENECYDNFEYNEHCDEYADFYYDTSWFPS